MLRSDQIKPAANRNTIRRYDARSRSRSRSSSRTRASSNQARDNYDYYFGWQSGHYRCPMMSSFVSSMTDASPSLHQPGQLERKKNEFQKYVQECWFRAQNSDPSVPHDTALRTLPWLNYLNRTEIQPSIQLNMSHIKNVQTSKFTMPNVWVYKGK